MSAPEFEGWRWQLVDHLLIAPVQLARRCGVVSSDTFARYCIVTIGPAIRWAVER